MWTIVMSESLIEDTKRYGIYDRVVRKLKDLQEMLDIETERALRILRTNPTIYVERGYRIKRMVIGDYRLFYYIDYDKKLIVFFKIKTRKKAYKKR